MTQQKVQGEQLILSIDGLTNVQITNPQAGQLIGYTGTQWTNTPPTEGVSLFNGATIVLTTPFNSEETDDYIGWGGIGSSFGKVVPFNSEKIDEGGWFNPAQPGRFTIPSGITKARFTASVRWNKQDIPSGSKLFMMLFRNGVPTGFTTGHYYIADRGGSAHNIASNAPSFVCNTLKFDSGWIPVNPGEYYEIKVTHLNFTPNVEIVNAWFSVEGETTGAAIPPPAPTVWNITPIGILTNQTTGTITFNVSRSSSTLSQIVYVSTYNDLGAINEGDYVEIIDQPLSFGIGETTKPVTVQILDNSGELHKPEPRESFRVVVHASPSDDLSTTYLTRASFTIEANGWEPMWMVRSWPYDQTITEPPIPWPKLPRPRPDIAYGLWTESSAGVVAAIKTDGTLWMWGGNNFGQLGLGDTIDRSSPVQVGSSTNWKHVSIFGTTTAGIKTDGTLWIWGNCSWYSSSTSWYDESAYYSTPIQVGSDTDWKQVSTGMTHIGVIKTNGTLWVAGLNNWGQLGLSLPEFLDPAGRLKVSSLTQVGSLTNWKQIEVHGDGMHAVKTDGTLWGWGQWAPFLEEYNISIRSSPIQLGSDTDWSEIVSKATQVLELKKTNGTLWSWSHTTWPEQQGTMTNWKAHASNYGIKTNGNLATYGFFTYEPEYGPNPYRGYINVVDFVETSDGTVAGRDWLTTGDWAETNAAGAAYGVIHFIKTDGTLWAMGLNDFGELGIGTIDLIVRSSPIQIGSLTDWAILRTY